jgi:hypothetical protein
MKTLDSTQIKNRVSTYSTEGTEIFEKKCLNF